ncbi:MAG TPA: DUF6785 family protein [Planctomycetota bacterium]|nr:DUF6785 family protein [Planctomycetota bacterium]
MTRRCFLAGVLLLLAIIAAMTYNDHALGNTPLTGGIHLPLVVAFLAIVFSALVNPILRRVAPRQVFSQAEIIVIWSMLAAGLTIPSCGVLRYLLPMLVAPFYFAGEGTAWQRAFHEHVPAWLVPSKDPLSPVVTMFYEGARGKPVPWDSWITPFFGWGVMLMAVFFVMFCLTSIVRRQWVEHERLTFPLARIPLEITAPPESGRMLNALFRNPATWLGVAIPVCFWGMAIVQKFYPWFPRINNANYDVIRVLHTMNGWQGLFNIYFLALGVTFMLPTDVSLSLWLFFVLGNVQRIIRYRYGLVGQEFDLQQQAGGYFAFAGIAIWTMRRHLRDVFRRALLGARDVDDSAEALPYRVAVFGGLLGAAVVVGWLCLAGCPLPVAVLVVLISCLGFLVLSRFVAQCGLIHVSFRPSAMPITEDLAGASTIGPRGLTSLTFYEAAIFGDQRETLMPSVLNSTRMAENRLSLRKLFAAMAVAVVISYSLAYFLQVWAFYRFGAGGENGYCTYHYPRNSLNHLASAVGTKEGILNIGWPGVRHLAIGAGAFVLVDLLRRRFCWWPIHPIGLLTIRTWPMIALWVSIFIGWACKALAQRYARGPMMVRLRFFFLGVIIGDILITMTGGLIGMIVGRQLIWTTS